MYRYENAACWGKTKLFFSESRIDQRLAADICGDCIYKQQCYDDAEARDERDGIHGGILFSNRKRIDPLAPKKPRVRKDRPKACHEIRTCPVCDTTFVTKNVRQKHDTLECNIKAKAIRRREARAA